MAKNKGKSNLYIVLVDGHGTKYMGANRGSGRWCVRAKNGKEAENVLAAHIGKTHGSIRCYYQVKEGSRDNDETKDLQNKGCRHICL